MKNRGKEFEAEIEETCRAYERQKVAKVHKVDPPTRVFMSSNARRVIMLGNPFLDFVGTICSSGRMLTFEAKHTEEPRLAFRSSGISENQLHALFSWQAAGALAFVLWRHRNETRLVTPADIRRAEAEDRSSIRWDTPGLPLVGQGLGMALVDFLNPRVIAEARW